MNCSKYLLITVIAISANACKPKPQPATNLPALKAADSALIMKTEPADSARTTDTASKPAGDEASSNVIIPKQLIIPGKSIGSIRIDESMETVFNRLGRPDMTDAAMGSSLAVWYAGHDKAGYKTGVFSHRNYNGKDDIFQYVKRILVTSPYFKTAEGLGAGSNIDQIREHYKLKPGKGYDNKGKNMIVHDDIAKGISFEVDPATNKCVGVLIQKAGDATGTYINMN